MVILGLGNPGAKYARTRHNAGFMVLDIYAKKEGLEFEESKIFHSHIVHKDGKIFAKSDTFMNDSGRAAKQLVEKAGNFSPHPLIVVHDDIDIPLGTVKCSYNRGSGDHNGVQSIIDHLGHQRFFRIRIGVRPVHEELLPRIAPPDGFEKFLLSNFIPMEDELLQQGINKAVEIISLIEPNSFSVEAIMNQCN